MHKALLKLLLALFLFSVIDQEAYSAPNYYNSPGADYYQTGIKIQAHALSLEKIVHQGVIVHPAHGSVKPLWVGNSDLSGSELTLTCHTLFLQNRLHIIHKQQFIRSLLFPYHFFG
jgi:hypothetical protein